MSSHIYLISTGIFFNFSLLVQYSYDFFRYLRSNIHTLVLIIKILNIYTREFGALLT